MEENGSVPAKYKSTAVVESMKSLRKPATRIPMCYIVFPCTGTRSHCLQVEQSIRTEKTKPKQQVNK